jgi:hypothetical protein
MNLEALLDEALDALVAGDLDRLARLTPQIASVELAVSDHRTAERLQAKAKRNARLLEAATRGVKAAGRRMAEIMDGPTLTTYNASGKKALIANRTQTQIRRV